MSMRVCNDALEAIGHTPLVRLSNFVGNGEIELFGKCEFMNPGGSIKDRIACYMVAKAESRGLLRPGGTIVEATAGNTGMGLAMAAARRGYRLVTVMTTKMSAEKVKLMRALGAEVLICPYEVPYGDPKHFMSRARALASETPGAWYVDQFTNQDNIDAHYASTGPEIFEQMEGRIDAVIAGMGTGGTLTGIAKYLRDRCAHVRIVLADPQGSILKSALEGHTGQSAPYSIEGIGGDFVPRNADLSLVDEAIEVADLDAIRAAEQLFRTEGLFVGGSSGVILAAALRYAQKTRRGRVVVLLPDSGRAYLSTIYDPQWRSSHGLETRPEPLYEAAG